MKKTYIIPATAASNISAKETILNQSKIGVGGTNKVTSEDQALSREDLWDDWDEEGNW